MKNPKLPELSLVGTCNILLTLAHLDHEGGALITYTGTTGVNWDSPWKSMRNGHVNVKESLNTKCQSQNWPEMGMYPKIAPSTTLSFLSGCFLSTYSGVIGVQIGIVMCTHSITII